jgi:hypothetical protein
MSKLGLDVPFRRLQREMAWLLTEFSSAASGSRDRQHQLACEMAVIRLHDSWARFCREVVILSALGNVVTGGGQMLARSHPSLIARSAVVPFCLRVSGWKWEPRWGDATSCVRAAQYLMIQNLVNVSSALGAANSPAENLRRVRNFYAHRHVRTSAEAMGTNLFVGGSPTVFHLNNYATGGMRTFESWTQGLVVVATAAIN